MISQRNRARRHSRLQLTGGSCKSVQSRGDWLSLVVAGMSSACCRDQSPSRVRPHAVRPRGEEWGSRDTVRLPSTAATLRYQNRNTRKKGLNPAGRAAFPDIDHRMRSSPQTVGGANSSSMSRRFIASATGEVVVLGHPLGWAKPAGCRADIRRMATGRRAEEPGPPGA